jgi:hypothetical protein
MADLCEKCGKNLALVGRMHHCGVNSVTPVTFTHVTGCNGVTQGWHEIAGPQGGPRPSGSRDYRAGHDEEVGGGGLEAEAKEKRGVKKSRS